jgi:hypothetical protein
MYLPTTNVLAFSTDGTERARITAGGEFLVGTTTVPTVTSVGTPKTLKLGNSLWVSDQFSLGSPYTQNIQIDIVWTNWGGNNVVGLVDIDVLLREYANTAGVAFGRIFATNSGGATFSTFNTTNVTESACSVTAASGGNYTLRITIDPTNVTDFAGIALRLPAFSGGTLTGVSSVTISLV